MPPDSQKPGEAQEANVRRRLSDQGYTQPYGSSDNQIRKKLSIRGKCADFLGYQPELDEWLVAESKGSDLDAAYEQLKNTMQALLHQQPAAREKVALQLHVSSRNYKLLVEGRDGLGGYRLQENDNVLGCYDEKHSWQYIEVDGVKIRVVREDGNEQHASN